MATLYNAGDYDSKLADDCLAFVVRSFAPFKGSWSKQTGHEFYLHLYAAQAFYQAGDKYWDDYFPTTRDQLRQMQQPDGSWDGDGIGPVYGASIALHHPPAAVQVPAHLPAVRERRTMDAECRTKTATVAGRVPVHSWSCDSSLIAHFVVRRSCVPSPEAMT